MGWRSAMQAILRALFPMLSRLASYLVGRLRIERTAYCCFIVQLGSAIGTPQRGSPVASYKHVAPQSEHASKAAVPW